MRLSWVGICAGHVTQSCISYYDGSCAFLMRPHPSVYQRGAYNRKPYGMGSGDGGLLIAAGWLFKSFLWSTEVGGDRGFSLHLRDDVKSRFR